MEVTKIAASVRQEIGKRAIKHVRAAGHVPAVVYGMGAEPEHVSLDVRDVERELRHRHRVFRIEVAGGAEQPVFLQDLQLDALTDEPMHIDFLRIDLDKPIQTEVQLVFLGVPTGAAKGGALMRDMQRLKIKTLPAALPREIEVKVGALDLDEEIRAKDLSLPEGVELDVSAEAIVCHVAS
ncbi:MAG: 50S ribosomal protein L25 [Planctomycetota bacterium]|nr:50S ribosomal protein L25 [Planctomycetota bacterium]MDA1220646.1 50S ribosomal protein L25 [Planctomycetota bacterium]